MVGRNNVAKQRLGRDGGESLTSLKRTSSMTSNNSSLDDSFSGNMDAMQTQIEQLELEKMELERALEEAKTKSDRNESNKRPSNGVSQTAERK